MKPAFCVVAVLYLFSIAAGRQKEEEKPRQFQSPAHFYKAEQFLEIKAPLQQETYTAGLMDGFYASAVFGAPDETIERLTSCTKGMDSKQITAIIVKYVKDRPEDWHYPLSLEAFNALNSACHGGLKPR